MTKSERAAFTDAYHLYEKYCDPPASNLITDETDAFWLGLSQDISTILSKENNRTNLFLNSLLLSVFREVERKSAAKT